MTTSFSSDGSAAISRRLSPLPSLSTQRDLRDYYEIDRCLDFIASNPSYKKIALQFPDHLLCDSVTVVTTLARESGQECVILGDTSYGSCCVDEVAASHASADCIIHYGPSCLTQTRRLPVLYVLGKEEVRIEECGGKFRELFPDRESSWVLILYDTVYSHCTTELEERLSDYPHLHQHTPHVAVEDKMEVLKMINFIQERADYLVPMENHRQQPHIKQKAIVTAGEPAAMTHAMLLPKSVLETTDCAKFTNRFGRKFKLDRPVQEYQVFYIGHEGQTLTNLIISYNQVQFYSYHPVSGVCRKESVSVNKALGRRYFLVQKAKEARTVGILVGTLGAADSLKMIQRLKTVLKQSGKRYYTIAVGKLNPAKMANFMEIDIFVLVACPENSLMDSQEFYKPVVTPFEMEVACLRGREWSGEIFTDYRELFPLPAREQLEDEEEEPEFSLVSGSLLPTRHHMADGLEGEKMEGGDRALAVRSTMEVALSHSAGEYLKGRSWRGLERRLGEGDVIAATEGRRGVASTYTHEQNHT